MRREQRRRGSSGSVRERGGVQQHRGRLRLHVPGGLDRARLRAQRGRLHGPVPERRHLHRPRGRLPLRVRGGLRGPHVRARRGRLRVAPVPQRRRVRGPAGRVPLHLSGRLFGHRLRGVPTRYVVNHNLIRTNNYFHTIFLQSSIMFLYHVYLFFIYFTNFV